MAESMRSLIISLAAAGVGIAFLVWIEIFIIRRRMRIKEPKSKAIDPRSLINAFKNDGPDETQPQTRMPEKGERL
jgi:hypothetical protein